MVGVWKLEQYGRRRMRGGGGGWKGEKRGWKEESGR